MADQPTTTDRLQALQREADRLEHQARQLQRARAQAQERLQWAARCSGRVYLAAGPGGGATTWELPAHIADDQARLYDGDPLVCLDTDCGLVHSMSADSEGWAVMDRRTLDDRWAYLTEPALRGARRLLGEP